VRRRAKIVALPVVAAIVPVIGASLFIFHHALALALDPGSSGRGGAYAPPLPLL
jgi:hypothetical protein